MTSTGIVQATFVGGSGGGGGTPLFYDWETPAGELTFTGVSYGVLAGFGIGGSKAGVCTGNDIYSATLPRQCTTFSLWIQSDASGAEIHIDAYLLGVFVSSMVITFAPFPYTNWAGTIGAFDEIRISFIGAMTLFLDNFTLN